jgi:hypothetical protein
MTPPRGEQTLFQKEKEGLLSEGLLIEGLLIEGFLCF